MTTRAWLSRAIVLTLLMASAVRAQPAAPRGIETIAVTAGVHMLTGPGGNVGVLSGSDGIVLIDDKFAPLAQKILAAVASIHAGRIRFILNTHWHGDHTGGNESLGAAGAVIVAHDNVRQRMSTEQFMKAFDRLVPPSPPRALPIVTFGEAITLHLNGEEIRVVHLAAAHTDGDAIIHLPVANVIHAGDTYFSGRYPVIDLSSGGSLDGMIAAVDRVLALANGETRIIPGHGDLSDRAGLVRYREMLSIARKRVAAEIAAGRSLEEVVASRPLADHDEEWGSGFVDPERFLTAVYGSLSADAD